MKQIFLPLLVSAIIVVAFFLGFEDLETYYQELLIAEQNDTSNYWLVSFLILSSDIVLPVPSSIVMYMNGLVLGVLYGFMLSLVSSMISSSIGYFLGRWTNFGFKEKSKSTHIIQNYGSVAIIISRGIPILSESICYTAGYNRMPFKNYFFLNVIGYVPVCLVYALFGQFGRNENMFLVSFLISLVVAGLVWYVGKSLMNKKEAA